MRLNTIFVRFYKSFNVDYKRQNNTKVKSRKPWEIIKVDESELWYPFIEVPIDSKITAVVGANESGKSHLLSAIEKAITGRGYKENHPEGEEVSTRDFCRYSERFLVSGNNSRLPDFGTEWIDISSDECNKIRQYSDIPNSKVFKRILLFRIAKNTLKIYISEGEEKYAVYDVKEEDFDNLISILPKTRRLKSNIALPSSLPIQQLVRYIRKNESQITRYEALEPKRRAEIRNLLDKIYDDRDLFTTKKDPYSVEEDISGKLILDLIATLREGDELVKDESRIQSNSHKRAETILAHDLLCTIAKINPDVIIDLAKAMSEDDIGYVQALVDGINKQFEVNLNFPAYWAQDSEFRILLSAKDHNIEFSIIDRTETKYSFQERSSGLKYFLSYFIQHRAYIPCGTSPDILLMDEPDTFLSSQAQQDLLKIFEEVANPGDDRIGSQVIYVTHSPFLIDKNHAERIRVLDKGSDCEGTKVVKNVSRTHYEPLRSAFGAFVAETVYISHCNLMVEGASDQVLLAGAATYLRRKFDVSDRECLNLNEITIVPAGGAQSIPYLTYLARGRDAEQPAVIVFLDSDAEGRSAKNKLIDKKEGPTKNSRLKEEFVLEVSDLKKDGIIFPNALINPEVEDLIPVPLAVKAAKRYAEEICDVRDRDLADINIDEVKKLQSQGVSLFKAVDQCVSKCSKESPHLEKIGFARYVIESLTNVIETGDLSDIESSALQDFEKNFKILFRRLDKMKSRAELDRTREKSSTKISDHVERFTSNYPRHATKGEVVKFLEQLEALVSKDESFDGDSIGKGIEDIRRKFDLTSNFESLIENFEEFKSDLKHLKHIGEVDSVDSTDKKPLEILQNKIEDTSDLSKKSDRTSKS
jgi:predicted ATP-dependent endonuclease of OLD family